MSYNIVPVLLSGAFYLFSAEAIYFRLQLIQQDGLLLHSGSYQPFFYSVTLRQLNGNFLFQFCIFLHWSVPPMI